MEHVNDTVTDDDDIELIFILRWKLKKINERDDNGKE